VEHKKIALGAFLNSERAFDRTLIEAIEKAARG
jgi:hypothetical protein